MNRLVDHLIVYSFEQANIGTIRSSNLCTEIVQYSSATETAVCNLASISLPSCIVENRFDHATLHGLVRQLVINLNRVVDNNLYPTSEARVSNMRHRPIGIGLQGLANVFLQLDLPFDSAEAAKLNRDIAETMYHAALVQSHVLAQRDGPYETFQGSPLSKGQFQFDLWDTCHGDTTTLSGQPLFVKLTK